jgi:hypothetical protein
MTDNTNETTALPFTKTTVNGVSTITVLVLSSGETKCVTSRSNPEAFKAVDEAIKEDRWDDVVAALDIKQGIVNYGDGSFEIVDDEVVVRGRPVPTVLSQKIIEFVRERLPHEPLLHFWDNLEQNPSRRAVHELFGFLEKNNHPITEDGCFIAYKGVREDWTDCRTGKIDNSIGTHVEVPRNEVDEDPNQSCSHGLHVGSYDGAKIWWAGSRHGLIVKINPKDVVAVPHDYQCGKMRVCAYDVLSESKDPVPSRPLYQTEPEPEPEPDDEPCCPDCNSSEDMSVDDTDEDDTPYQWNCFNCGKSFRRCTECSEIVQITNHCSNCGQTSNHW